MSTQKTLKSTATGDWLVKEATKQDILAWNDNNEQTPFTQTREFAEVKSHFGWKARYLIAEQKGEVVKLVALERSLPFLGKLWYIPCGPTTHDITHFSDLMAALHNYSEAFNVFLIKVEPLFIATPDNKAVIKADAHLQQQPPIQPPNTLYVNMSGDEEFTTLGRRARRYARQARSEGVVVRDVPVDDAHCKVMYDLMQTANGGNGVPGQQRYEYYVSFWKTFATYGTGSLWLAYEGETPVAGAYIIARGKTVVYKDGGSTANRTSKGVAYYLHAEIMRHFALKGFERYDMWGMPPSDRVDDRSHPLYGIGQFKLAFSKDITEHVGCFDYDGNSSRAWLWRRFGYSAAVRVHHWLGRGNFW